MAVAREGRAVTAKSLAPAREPLAVCDIHGAGAFLDCAVDIGYPDLEHVERHRLGQGVHLLFHHGAPVGGGGVHDPVDRKRRQVDESQGVGRRGRVGAHRIDEAAEQIRDPVPEAARRRHREATEHGVETLIGSIATVYGQIAAALHQDLGHSSVERQGFEHPHPGPGRIGVGDRRGHDHGARDRHGEFAQVAVRRQEARRLHRAPGVVHVDRRLVLERAGCGGQGRVAFSVRAAAVARGGVIRKNALPRPDRGADRGARPVVLRPDGADESLGRLAGVQVLVVHPLGERSQLRHGLGDHGRDGLECEFEGEARCVLGDGAGEGDHLVGIDERERACERVDAAAAGAVGGQAHRGDGFGAHRRSQVEVAERPVARGLSVESGGSGGVHRGAPPEVLHLGHHVRARGRGEKEREEQGEACNDASSSHFPPPLR